MTTRPVLNTERANGGDRRLRLAPLPGPASDGAVSPGPLHGRTHPPPHTHTHTSRSTVTPSPASPRKAFSSSPPSVFCVLVDGALLPAGDAAFHPASCLRAATPGSPGPAGPRYGLASAHGFGQQPRTDDSRLPSPSLARRRLPVLVPDGDLPTGPSIRSYDRRLEPDTFKIKHMNSSSHVLKMWVPLASLRVPQARSQEDHSSTSALTHSLIRHLWARSPPLTASCSQFKFWSAEEGGLLLVVLGRGGGRV